MHPQLLPDPPGKIPPYIWHSGARYWSIVEEAKRRACTPQAVRKWAKHHPDQVHKHNGHTYVKESQ